MILRIASRAWSDFEKELSFREDVETAGVILAERLAGGEVFIARHLHLVPEDGYTIREADKIQIAPVAINQLVHRARAEGLSVFTIHTHPGTEKPWFSWADDRGDSILMPSFYNQMDGPHGSLVLATASQRVIGRIWSEGGESRPLRVEAVGLDLKEISIQSRSGPNEPKNDWHARQVLALGKAGQERLRQLQVGVVGAGGTGSVTASLMGHLGVGRLLVMDADVVEGSNLSRILGSRVGDVGQIPKVEIVRRMLEEQGLGTHVRALPEALGAGGDGDRALEACDVIMSCVDRHTPRALLNRIAYRASIPVIDMGSGFSVDREGTIQGAGGRVVVIGPGRPCLACWGHLDPVKLREENLSLEERAQQFVEGYIQGAEVAQPSVIPFNTVVAGTAVIEFLRLVTGFGRGVPEIERLGFDFLRGTCKPTELAEGRRCKICSNSKASSSQAKQQNVA